MFSLRKLLLGLTALVFAVALSACSPAQSPAPAGLPPEIPAAPPVGTGAGQTDAPVHFVTGGDGVPFTSQPIPWDDGREVVGITIEKVDLDDLETVRFPYVDGAVTTVPFLSLPGEERKRAAWKAWGDSGPLDGKGAWFPTVTPYKLLYGNGLDVKRDGGAYSLGFAYLAAGDSDVLAVYFNTIYVAPASGDFTFSTPTV